MKKRAVRIGSIFNFSSIFNFRHNIFRHNVFRFNILRLNVLLVVLVVFTLMLAHHVSATITIDPLSRNIFNYGDQFVISGNVEQVEDMRAFLSINMVCPDKVFPLYTTLADLKQGKPQVFSKLVNVPSKINGDCKLEVKLTRENEVIDSAYLSGFIVTNELEGSFEVIVNNNAQLGNNLVLNGAIFKKDKGQINGNAVIYFKQSGEILFSEPVEIKLGQFAYTKSLVLIPAGSYTTDIEVKDNNGNFEYFSNIGRFELTDKLGVEFSTDKNLYNPGETLVLTGYIKSFVGSEIKDIAVEANFDGQVLFENIINNKVPFNLRYNIPSNIKRGFHNIKLIVKDEKGNYGIALGEFNVKAIPTTMAIYLNKTKFIPGEPVVFKTKLLDQAGDLHNDNIFVKLYNKKGEFEKSKLVSSNGYDFINIPKDVLPSQWKINVEGLGLTDGKTIEIIPYKKIISSISDDGYLYIWNIGNIPYDDFVDIQAGNILRGKKVYLGINESIKLRLGDLFDSGNYNLTVVTTGQDFSDVGIVHEQGLFSGLVGITGNAISNAATNIKAGNKPLLFVLFLGLIVGLVFVLRPGKKEVYTDEQRAKDIKDGQKKLEELRAKGIRKGPTGGFGIATEQDRKDFAIRMAKQVEEEQERISKESFSRKWSGNSEDAHNYSYSNPRQASSKREYAMPTPTKTKQQSSSNSDSGNALGSGLINW